MSAVRDVAVFIGSLRKDSINRKLAYALAELAPSSLKLQIVEISQLPLYNQEKYPATLSGFTRASEGGGWRSICHART